MSNGILSQAEIDALLSGSHNGDVEKPADEEYFISDYQKDTLGEIGNISMGTAATTLSMLLQRKVSITTPDVSITTRSKIQDEYPIPYVIVEVEYKEGLHGTNILSVKEHDACVIADLMMGREVGAENSSLDEIAMSALGEAMNQMMGSATTSLSSMFNMKIDIAPPVLHIIDLGKENLPIPTDYGKLVKIRFKMVIEGLLDSEIMQIIPMEAVNTMINVLERNVEQVTAQDVAVPKRDTACDLPLEPQGHKQNIFDDLHTPAPASAKPNFAPAPGDGGGAVRSEPFTVQPVQFSILQEQRLEQPPQNIDLIMDVPLDVSVELGKTRKTIKETLELQQGSIIQLDKMAGEPVDLLVNGKLIAKGEVVVIDENYGIRITTIISPMDRMNKLQ